MYKFQEQLDLDLALKLAQEDIERTGRDYLLEVDKLTFGGVDQNHQAQPSNQFVTVLFLKIKVMQELEFSAF